TPLGWRAQVELLGGDGVAGDAVGPGPRSRFSDPWGVALDAGGTLYVADAGDNNRILRRWLDGDFRLLAGGREGFADGLGPAAACPVSPTATAAMRASTGRWAWPWTMPAVSMSPTPGTTASARSSPMAGYGRWPATTTPAGRTDRAIRRASTRPPTSSSPLTARCG